MRRGAPAASSGNSALALELFSIAGSLSSTLDLDFLLEKIGAAAEKLLDSEASSIMLVTDDRKSLFFRVAGGEVGSRLKKMTLPLGQGIAGWVATNRKPQLVNDAQKDSRFAGKFDRASGFVTRSLLCVPMLYRGELVGVVEVLNKRRGEYTQDDVELLAGLANVASVAVMNATIVRDQKNFFSHVLEILASSIETSKPRMVGHPARAARLSCALGAALGMEGDSYRMMYYAGLLHDIGYVGFKNPSVLAQLGITDPAEQAHPVLSCKMLEGINILQGALPIIRHHHECYDGSGFPGKLAAEQIPLGARILALVEALEDLRMMGLSGTELILRAKQEAKAGRGTRFDPQVVDTALELLGQEGVW